MMMETIMSRSLRLVFTGSAAIGIGMLAQPVLAQESTDTAAPVQRVEITGSNIRRVDSETPSPVQVISAEDMKKSGFTTVAEVLQSITANGQGSLSNLQSGASFAAGASGIALRGLNTASTLVLIDGHRMAPYAIPDNAQYSFTDISSLPFDAIERIEVLKDGASAVYGSDAIAGVVNIILRRNFVGTKVSAEGGGTQEGGAATVHASVLHGMGDLSEDGYNAYVNLEVRHQDSVSYASRAGRGQWSTPDFTAYGGNTRVAGVPSAFYPNPVTASPYLLPNGAQSNAGAYFQPGASCTTAQLNGTGCPWIPYSQLAPETENINLITSFTKRLNDGWELNVKASFFDSKTNVNGNLGAYPNAYSNSVYPTYIAGQPSGGGIRYSASSPIPTIVGPAGFNITVPANYPGNGLGVPAQLYGANISGPGQWDNIDVRTTRLVGDLNGSIGEWDIKASLGYVRNNAIQNQVGSMNLVAFNAAINRTVNPYNVFSKNNSAADNAAIYPNLYSNSESLLEFGEVHASRSLMALPGGDLGFSTGASYIHKELNTVEPEQVSSGLLSGNPFFAEGQQNDASVYAEVVAPVFKSLEVDVDERFDHIDTYGNSVTGKAAFKWSPTNSFALRGAASTGFRAPNVAESGNSGSVGFFGNTNDHTYCSSSSPYSAVYVQGSNYCNYAPPIQTSGNPDLKPERSVSLTLGAIFEPVKGWSSTMDLYRITVNDQIENPTPNLAVLTPVRGTTPVAATCILASNPNAAATPCPFTVLPALYYPQEYINLNSTMVDGFEFATSYKFNLNGYGKLKAELDWTHQMSYQLTSGGQTYQLNGTHGPSAISNDTGNPSDRVDAVFTWEQGPLQVATAFNWISSFSVADPSAGQVGCAGGITGDGWFFPGSPNTVPNNYCRVASFLNTNLTARYNYGKQWVIHGAITNLFDRQPPVDLETYGNLGVAANTTLHAAGVYGRGFNVGASYSF